MVVEAMAQTGKEPTFCMGNAWASEKRRVLARNQTMGFGGKSIKGAIHVSGSQEFTTLGFAFYGQLVVILCDELWLAPMG